MRLDELFLNKKHPFIWNLTEFLFIIMCPGVFGSEEVEEVSGNNPDGKLKHGTGLR